MKTKPKTARAAAVAMVLAVMEDGTRIDRYLAITADGRIYTTDSRTDVYIPVAYDVSYAPAAGWAEAIVDELLG